MAQTDGFWWARSWVLVRHQNSSDSGGIAPGLVSLAPECAQDYPELPVKAGITAAGGRLWRLPSARRLSSILPSTKPFGPTMTCQGMPIRSVVANFEPGR